MVSHMSFKDGCGLGVALSCCDCDVPAFPALPEFPLPHDTIQLRIMPQPVLLQFYSCFCAFKLSKFQRVHIFVKSRKVQNMAQSTKMADGVYPKLYIFNTPVQKEGNLPGFHIHTVCNLPFGHSSELKVIFKYM